MRNLLLLTLLSITLFSCKKDSDITMNFKHDVALDDFEMDEFNYLSPVGHNYSITKLQYYVSEITFIKDDGTKSVIEGGHLINLSNENSLSFPLLLEGGTYNKIEFQFGISKENNVDSYLENTLENQNMAWPVQMEAAGEKGAYHYMQFEGKYDSLGLGVIKPFIYHAGPTNGADNSFKVSLNIDELNTKGKSYDVNIGVDLQEWFQNPTEYDFKDYKMVMMNQATQEIYQANGKSVFSFSGIIKNE